MDIQHLHYFSRVYEAGNYAVAATQLYLSRQGLRKAVQRLESELGEVLFTSEGNRLHATSAATQLYQASRPLLKSYAEFERNIAQFKVEHLDVINYGQSRESDESFMFSETQMFHSHAYAPDSIVGRMRTVEGSCAKIREMMLAEEITYGCLIATSMNETLFDYEVARSGHIYIAVPKDDPLASKEALAIADLRGRRFTTQGPGYDIHDFLERQAQKEGFSLDVVDVMSGLHSRLGRVDAGLSLTYSYHDTPFPNATPNIVCLPLDHPGATWEYCAFGKNGLADPYLVRFFAGKEGPFAESTR